MRPHVCYGWGREARGVEVQHPVSQPERGRVAGAGPCRRGSPCHCGHAATPCPAHRVTRGGSCLESDVVVCPTREVTEQIHLACKQLILSPDRKDSLLS